LRADDCSHSPQGVLRFRTVGNYSSERPVSRVLSCRAISESRVNYFLLWSPGGPKRPADRSTRMIGTRTKLRIVWRSVGTPTLSPCPRPAWITDVVTRRLRLEPGQ